MSSFISYIAATFITVPLLSYLVIFIISKQITGNHRRSVNLALDIATVFFILAVHFLIVTIWERSLLWVILLVMLSVAIIFVVVHWKTKQEIVFPKVFKGFWRFNLLLFLSAYIMLVLFGVFTRLAEFLHTP